MFADSVRMRLFTRVPSRLAALGIALVLASAVGIVASSASGERVWHLQNQFACTGPPGNQTCGPHNQMQEGGGNGVFPSGFILVRDGESRIWVAPASLPVDFARRTWSLTLGGLSVVSRATWTVGIWDWSSATFTPASGAESVAGPTGAGTFTPASPFSIAGGRHLALRITGASGVLAPNAIDVYDETGGNSPSTLSISG